MKINEYIKKIQTELSKLKDSKDEKVKEVYTNVETILTEMTPVEKTEEKKEDAKEDDVKKSDESKDEPEKEPESKEPEDKEAKKEPEENGKAEDVKKTEVEDEKELSLEVSKKLSEAAVELSKHEKDIAAKEEVIETYKVQVKELSAELEKYKAAEKIELDAKFDAKVNGLVELYASLGVKRDLETIKTSFNEEQIDNLILDLSAMKPKPVETKSVRKTPVSVDLELTKHNKKETKLSDSDIANALFDF